MATAPTSELAQFLQRTWQAHAHGKSVARYERLTSEVERRLATLGLTDVRPEQSEVRAEQGLEALVPDARRNLESLLDHERMAWLEAYGRELPSETHHDFGSFARSWLEHCRQGHLRQEREAGAPMLRGYFYERRIPGDHLTSRFLVGANDAVTQVDAWEKRDGMLVPQTGSALLQTVLAVADRAALNRDWAFRARDGKETSSWRAAGGGDYRVRAVAFLGLREPSSRPTFDPQGDWAASGADIARVLMRITRHADRGTPLRDGPQTRLVVEGWNITESVMSELEVPPFYSAAPPFYDDAWWAKEYRALQALAVPPMAAERMVQQQALTRSIEERYRAPVLLVPPGQVIRGRVDGILANELDTRAVVRAEEGLYLFGGSEQNIGQWRALRDMPVQLSRSSDGVRLELLAGHRHQRALVRDVGHER